MSTACRWVVYEGGATEAAEPVWTTRLNGPTGPAQIAIKGAAGTDEYRTLAAATQNARHCPRSRAPRALAITDGDAMTMPEADLTGWTAAAVHRRRLHPRRLSQGRGPRRGADPRDAGRFIPACWRWVIIWWTTGSPSPRRRCSARRARRRSGRGGAGDAAWLCGKGIRGVRDQRRPAGRALPARAGPRPQREDAGQGRRGDRPVLHRRLRARGRGRRQRARACAEPAVAADGADAQAATRSRPVRGRVEDRRTARRQRGTVRVGSAVQRGSVVPGGTVQDAQGPARRRVRGHRDQLEEGQRARVRQDGALGADAGAARAGRPPRLRGTQARRRIPHSSGSSSRVLSGASAPPAFVAVRCARRRLPRRARQPLSTRRLRRFGAWARPSSSGCPSGRPCTPRGRR